MENDIKKQSKDIAMNPIKAINPTDSMDPLKSDLKKVRRRIEDALRKTATREQLIAIAQMLQVKLE